MTPHKTCPQCSAVNHARRKACTVCGHVFQVARPTRELTATNSAGYHTPCLPAAGALALPPATPEPTPAALLSQSALDQLHDAMLAHRRRELSALVDANASLRTILDHTKELTRSVPNAQPVT